MNLKEISLFEARLNDVPASEPGEGEICIWYALEDEDEYKGFMEVTQNEAYDISEISYFMIPDIYQGNGYGKIMLELFLDKYIGESGPESLLTIAFSYNSDYGKELTQLFSNHGFEFGISTYEECFLPFDTVYDKLSYKKLSSYPGLMMKLAEGMEVAASGVHKHKDSEISTKDLHDADSELSVLLSDQDGNLEGILLASKSYDRSEEIITDLYIAKDDPLIMRTLLGFAVENAGNSYEPPQYISFTAANEKLEKVMESVFDNPKASVTAVAEGEFNFGKYVAQLEISESLRR